MLTLIIIAVVAAAAAAVFYFKKKSQSSGAASLTLSAVSASTRAKLDNGATAVVVKFKAVELKPVDGKAVLFDFAEPKMIDLLATETNKSNALLDGQAVPAGKYEWIRLKALAERGSLESYVQLPDGQYPLWIPSGTTSGLKLTQGFVMPEGEPANFAIDFDVAKSLLAPPGHGGDFTLKPTLKLIDNYVPAPVVEEPVVEEPVVEEPAPEAPKKRKYTKKVVAKKPVAKKRKTTKRRK